MGIGCKIETKYPQSHSGYQILLLNTFYETSINLNYINHLYNKD